MWVGPVTAREAGLDMVMSRETLVQCCFIITWWIASKARLWPPARRTETDLVIARPSPLLLLLSCGEDERVVDPYLTHGQIRLRLWAES